MTEEFSPSVSEDVAIEVFRDLLSKYDLRILREYDRALGSTGTSTSIGLDDAPEDIRQKRIEQLTQKQEEYTQRIWKVWAQNQTLSFAQLSASSRYKRDLVSILLLRRLVNINALYLAYMLVDKRVNENKFDNACGVIEDYILTGGANLEGGTPLS